MLSEAQGRVRARLDRDGWTPEMETRIALFLCATRAVNLPFLSVTGAGPAGNPAWQALTSRLFRDSEAMTRLLRVTHWSPDLRLYWQHMSVVAPLYADFARSGVAPGALGSATAGLEAIALAHAVYSRLKLSAILPRGPGGAAEFARTLIAVDHENGRLHELQIRLLQDRSAGIPGAECEAILATKAALVDALCARFLAELADPTF